MELNDARDIIIIGVKINKQVDVGYTKVDESRQNPCYNKIGDDLLA